MSIVTFVYIISFILIQESFLNYASGDTNYENKNYHRSSWNSDFDVTPQNRSKRSLSQLMPAVLKCRIRNKNSNPIVLIWRKTKQFLANEYLRISMSIVDSAMNPNVMNNVGEFVMYRDLAKSSAVVYFAKDNAFYGVVGMDYYIRGLPYNFDDMGNYRADIIRRPYLEKSPHIPVHTLNTVPSPLPDLFTPRYFPHRVDDRPDPSNTRPTDAEPEPSNKRQRLEWDIGEDYELYMRKNVQNASHSRERRQREYGKDYYSETLIFITKDLVDHFRIQFGEECIVWIVRHNIIYFSAIDMMMAKLPNYYGSHVHINIARIVIQDGTYPADSTNDNTLQFNDTVTKYRQFLYGNQNSYTPDSFDHVFIYTSRQIFDGPTAVDGATQSGKDMYLARMFQHFYHDVPISIVQFESSYLDYPVALHEIAKVFGVSVDSHENGNSAIGLCHSPMQKGGAKCAFCLQWCDDSKKQFKEFIKTSRNRCFLENRPRSLLPPGPRHFLSPRSQCLCFGYDFHAKHDSSCPSRYVSKNSCGTPLRCRGADRERSSVVFTVPPLDGTACGPRMVCWEGQCVDTLLSFVAETHNSLI